MPPRVQMLLTLEDSLASRLKPQWNASVEARAVRLTNALLKGESDRLEKELESLNTASMSDGLIRYIDYVGTAAMIFGASRVSGVHSNSLVKAGTRPEILNSATKQFGAILREFSKTIRKQLNTRLEEMAKLKTVWEDEQGRVRKADEDEMFVEDFVTSKKVPKGEMPLKAVTLKQLNKLFSTVLTDDMTRVGNDLIDLGASLHSSRMASYGFLLEAQLTGVTKYMVDEQMDSRTCPVCYEMNGTEFTVEPAFDKLDQVLRLEDPEDLKQIAPWPSQTKANVELLKGMSAAERQMAGWDTPPYHPLCRGILQLVEDTRE